MSSHLPSISRLPMGCRSANFDCTGGSTVSTRAGAAAWSAGSRASVAFSGAPALRRDVPSMPASNWTSRRAKAAGGRSDQCSFPAPMEMSPLLKSYTSAQLFFATSRPARLKCAACPGYDTLYRSKRMPADVSTTGPSVCTNRSHASHPRVRSWRQGAERVQPLESRRKTEPLTGPSTKVHPTHLSMVTWLVQSSNSTVHSRNPSSSTVAPLSSPLKRANKAP
mmetsp:Transcript_23077/g.58585  ORF Transcript_23077/g.58585 Transcript_23077/m.58585 type:complete len:223 (+) Transcript_23077:158-826(+)